MYSSSRVGLTIPWRRRRAAGDARLFAGKKLSSDALRLFLAHGLLPLGAGSTRARASGHRRSFALTVHTRHHTTVDSLQPSPSFVLSFSRSLLLLVDRGIVRGCGHLQRWIFGLCRAT
jgi:hypothetical protein